MSQMKTEMWHWEHHNRLWRDNELNGGCVFIVWINRLMRLCQTNKQMRAPLAVARWYTLWKAMSMSRKKAYDVNLQSTLKRELRGMWSRVIWVHPWRKPEVKDVKWMTNSKHFSLKWGSVDKGLSAIQGFHALMFEYNLNSGHSTGFWTVPMLSRKFIVLWLMSWPYLAHRYTQNGRAKAWKKYLSCPQTLKWQQLLTLKC